MSKYKMIITLLTQEEGGGYMVSFPDAPGCMSDGETIEEAKANALDALDCWLEAYKNREGKEHDIT